MSSNREIKPAIYGTAKYPAQIGNTISCDLVDGDNCLFLLWYGEPKTLPCTVAIFRIRKIHTNGKDKI